MDDMTPFEDRFEERVRAFARTGVQSVDSRPLPAPWRSAIRKGPSPGRLGVGSWTISIEAVSWPIFKTTRRCGGDRRRRSRARVGVLAVIGGPSPTPSVHPSPSLPGVVRSEFDAQRRPRRRPRPRSRLREESGSPPGRWVRLAPATPRCGCSMAGCSSWAAPAMRTTPPRSCTTRHRDLVCHREHAQAPRWLPGLPGPHCCAMAGCSLGMQTTRARSTRSSVPRCTTRTAGRGRRGEDDRGQSGHWPRRCATTGCWSRVAMAPHPSCTTRTAGRGPRGEDGHIALSRATRPILLPDGKVLVAGSEDMSDGDRAALYDPATGTWTATGTMGTPRLEHLAVTLLDGRVLVVGGAYDDQDDTSAEVYDPATGSWSATGSMLKPHTRFPATVLADGRVLVGDADGAELYDPDSGTWSVTEKMVIPTSGSATLLLDGTVLVAGSGGSARVVYPCGRFAATRGGRSLLRPAPGSAPGRCARLALVTPRCDSSMGGCSSPADPTAVMRTT